MTTTADDQRARRLRALGARLRSERKRHGWSKVEMARRLMMHITDQCPSLDTVLSYIKRWEAGKVGVSERHQFAYGAAFGMDTESLENLFNLEDDTQPLLNSGLLPPGPDLASRVAAITGRKIGTSTVADLSARVHALRVADDVLAGHDLIVPAFRELNCAVRLYENSTHVEPVEREMLSVIGEFAQIAGWVASDAGQTDEASKTYRLGIDAAQEAGDGTLESLLTGSLAYQTANIGTPGEAIELVWKALDVAGKQAPPRARALAWDRIAWAHARRAAKGEKASGEDVQTAMRALRKAGEAFAEYEGDDDPDYLYWVSASELRVMEARVYTEIRRPLRAVPLLVEVLNQYDATHTRELALYLSWLAVALADANEPEEAAAAAARVLELSSELTSERTAQRARVVRARLEPYRDVPAVREVLRDHP